MRFVALVVAAGIAPFYLSAQKIDSLLLQLPLPKERAAEAVVQAFTRAGLTVSNTTPFLIEADEGGTPNWAVGGQARRIVRAVLLPSDSSTSVLITGTEERTDQFGGTRKRLRIDNHAGGNGGKVWKKIVAAAIVLDSTAVPDAAKVP
jgi:hypothetical protein